MLLMTWNSKFLELDIWGESTQKDDFRFVPRKPHKKVDFVTFL